MPFSIDQFLSVFGRYNDAVWPMQYGLYLLAAVAIAGVIRGTRGASRLAALVLALLWIWAGVVYHLGFFRAINPAAAVFGVAFVLQAALFIWLGFVRDRLRFSLRDDASRAAAIAIVGYGLVVYPLLGRVLGHVYPFAPTFGAPCPTTIFTFGMLLFARPPRPRLALVIPVLWTIVATIAALQLGMLEDLGLAVAAAIAVVVEWIERSRRHSSLVPAK